jgi:YD repeat-containing protein
MHNGKCGFSSSDFDLNKAGKVRNGVPHSFFSGLFLALLIGWSSFSSTATAQDDTTPPLTGSAPASNDADVGTAQVLDSGAEPAVDPASEYGRLVRSPSATGALDSGLLGESVDFYTGQTDFVTTDVSLPLNFGIPMAIGRRYHVDNRSGGVLQGTFGDWDLEIPHIEGIVANSVGWVASGAGYNECSDFSSPPDATVTTTVGTKNYKTTLPASEYAIGYSVVVPGKGRHELLLRSATNRNVPDGDFANYPVVTHDWWAVTCANLYDHYTGQPDESFRVTSPDGVTYDFGYFTSRPYPSYQRQADAAPSGTLAVLPRTQVFMLPYTVTDRFGNWVKYTYQTDPRVLGNHILTGITSSDGHTITITYNTSGLISVIEDNLLNQGRQWKYTYTSGALTKVTLPDGSYWSIDFANLNNASWSYTNPTCSSLPTPTIPTGSIRPAHREPSLSPSRDTAAAARRPRA